MSLPQKLAGLAGIVVAAVISISALSQRHPKPATFNAPPYNRNGATQSPLGTITPNGANSRHHSHAE